MNFNSKLSPGLLSVTQFSFSKIKNTICQSQHPFWWKIKSLSSYADRICSINNKRRRYFFERTGNRAKNLRLHCEVIIVQERKSHKFERVSSDNGTSKELEKNFIFLYSKKITNQNSFNFNDHITRKKTLFYFNISNKLLHLIPLKFNYTQFLFRKERSVRESGIELLGN